MTPEEKQLLLKDICARLPYGIHCLCNNGDRPLTISYINKEKVHIEEYPQPKYDITDIKPYLRPMSSMTEEEKKKVFSCISNGWETTACKEIDWLNAHHFDYRGLIPMGLALEAPEGMYKAE